MSNPRRSGFTIIELIATIGILCLMVAILLSAIQSARESARRMQCTNNLKQLGLALSAYHSAVNCFPPGSNGLKAFSPHSMLLPQLDQAALFNSLNFSAAPAYSVGPRSPNHTAANTSISTLLCPSDFDSSMRDSGCVNYPGSRGSGAWGAGGDGIFGPAPASFVRAGDVLDGLSNTAAFSEALTSPRGDRSGDAKRLVFSTGHPYGNPGQFDEFVADCLGIGEGDRAPGPSTRGTLWIHGDYNYTLYNHAAPLNSPSCTNGGSIQDGAWTASSLHPGGANILHGDGHVRFAKGGMDLKVWRALGSRSGRDFAEF